MSWRPSQHFAVITLVLLAGGDSVLREIVIQSLRLFGVHVGVPNCYIGSGPGC